MSHTLKETIACLFDRNRGLDRKKDGFGSAGDTPQHGVILASTYSQVPLCLKTVFQLVSTESCLHVSEMNPRLE